MLCASVLAALEAAIPPEQRPPLALPCDEVASSHSSSSVGDGSLSTATVESLSSPYSVGAPRSFSEHADGTTIAYNSVEKWILAALKHLGKSPSELVLPSLEPNNALCSEVHSTIAMWHTSRTSARDAGVVDHRPSEQLKSPQQECLVKARGWLLRHINQARAKHRLQVLPERWGRELASVRADARAVNTSTKRFKQEAGTLYHHKHDVAPTQEELTTMMYVGWSGDQRVDADVLDALEAGVAIALYLPTGARGSELKRMHLQSLGHESIQDERSGLTFDCLKLTAFDTKTKAQHLNQFLPHSNPWRCGVGLLGVSLLVRRKLHGPPPFTMQTNEHSWKVLGTNMATMDRRIKDTFKVAGLRRQSGDLVTLLGRHYGTRLLQHAGGSAEGGAVRRGHSNGTASHHYTECPLPDLLKLAGNDSDKPFTSAHHHRALHPLVDAVLLILFPELNAHQQRLDARQRQVDAMRGISDKVRKEEQLNDQQRLVRSIRTACRIALCCLVARPRAWHQWTILEDEGTVWQRATENNHRVVKVLFAGNEEAIEAMNALAVAVRRHEEAEIDARKSSPDNAITTQVVSAITDIREQQAAREKLMLEQQQAMFQRLMAMVPGSTASPPEELPPPPAEAPPIAPPAPSCAVATPLASARLKHKRESQDDVRHFSTFDTVSEAMEYAREELAPREREARQTSATGSGRAWRVLKREDGREDKSRDKQWRCYCSLATSLGLLIRGQKTWEEAVSTMQARLDGLGPNAHTRLLRELNTECQDVRDADALAKEVLGF